MQESYSVEAILSVKDRMTSDMKKAAGAIGIVDTNSKKATSTMKGVAVGAAAFKVVEAAVNLVTASLDKAISRYDTLNRFPRVLENMGYSANQASTATDKLSDGVQGLPTSLDEIVANAQNLTVLTGNLELATDTALALNNAFYASGAVTEDASRGLRQYTQMLSKGKVDLQSWRTLQETMGYALSKTAESFGYTGQSAQTDFYAALKNGDVTFDEFNSRLIELNEGVGGFAEMAKTSTGGIGTAWTNMGTAVARGTANVISAIDSGLSDTKFKGIENSISSMGKGIDNVLSNVVAPALGFVAQNADKLVIVLGGVAAGFAVWNGAVKPIQGTLERLNTLEQVAAEQGVTLNEVLNKSASAEGIAAQAALEREAAIATKRAAQQEEVATELEKIAVDKQAIAEAAKANAQYLKSPKLIQAEEAALKARNAEKKAEEAVTKLSSDALKAEEAAKKAATIASQENATAAQKGKAAKLAEKSATAQASAAEAKQTLVKKQAATAAAMANVETAKSDAYKAAETNATIANTVAEEASGHAKTARGQAEHLNTVATELSTKATDEQSISSLFGASVVGLLTGKITLHELATNMATIATKAFNAATQALSGPLGIIILVVGALVGAIIGLTTWIGKNNAAYDEGKDAIDGYKNKNEELKESLGESTTSYDNNAASAQGNADISREMAKSVNEAADSYDGSAASARKMQAKVNMLNQACQGLNLTFDETTGELSQTADQIEDYIKAAETASKKTALSDHMTELNKVLSDTQAELIKAEMEVQHWNEQVASGEMTQKQGIELNREMEKTIEGLATTYAETSEEMARYAEFVAEVEAEEKAAQRAAIAEQELTVEEWSSYMEDRMYEAAGEILVTYETMTDGLSNLGEKIVQDNETTWNDIKSNQADTIKQVTEFAELYAQLIKAGVSDSYLEAIGATGPESIPLLKDMLNSGTDEVLKSQDEWEAAYEQVAKGPLTDVLKVDDETATAIQDFVTGKTGIYGNLQDAIEGVNFGGLMDKPLQDTAKGIGSNTAVPDSGKQLVEETKSSMEEVDFTPVGEEMAAEIGAGFGSSVTIVSGEMTELKSTMQTHLASVKALISEKMETIEALFKISFNNIVANGKNGLSRFNTAFSDGLNKSRDTARTAATSIANVLNLYTKLYTSGVNSMKGFNSGLITGSSAVYATAQSIALNVAATINKALDIHSPSRVTRWSGRNTMAGLNLGLIDGQDDVFATIARFTQKVESGMTATMQSARAIGADFNFSASVNDSTTSGLLERLIAVAEKGQVIVLDSGAIVGGTFSKYDHVSGETESYNNRWGRLVTT